MTNVRSVLLTALDPVERAASAPQEIYRWLSQDFNTLNQLENDKKQLETENLLLKAQLQQLNRLKIEVSRLNALLGTASQTSQDNSRIATVIGYSDSPTAHFFTINKGSLDEIAPNLAVIDAQGVMGKTTLVGFNSSRVLLITDPDSQIPVRIQRTGQRGILTGTGSDQLSLEFIPNTSSIIIGDILETSGLGEIFPEGYPVATISQIKNRDDQPYYEIFASPAASLHISNKVLVLNTLKSANSPIESLSKTFMPENGVNND